MGKINLDKYYTSQKIAEYCIDTFNKVAVNFKVTEIIDPSAGNGSFSLQIQDCIAYDLEPGHKSIIKRDFLKLRLMYKKGRLFIGNPPFGIRNTLSVKFYKHSCKMGDYIAFILPASQYNNSQQMYEFDLLYSEMLPLVEYSGRKLLCCFNIYKRPKQWLNTKPIDYKLKDVKILEWRRGVSSKVPKKYDIGICGWGSAIGKEIKYQGQYVLENYIISKKEEFTEKIIEVLKNAKWIELYPNIATPRLGQWKIYKYLKEQIPELK